MSVCVAVAVMFSATRLVSCERCERLYIVSSEGESQPQKIPTVDDLCPDRQPFPKYKQPPVPTKVTLSTYHSRCLSLENHSLNLESYCVMCFSSLLCCLCVCFLQFSICFVIVAVQNSSPVQYTM